MQEPATESNPLWWAAFAAAIGLGVNLIPSNWSAALTPLGIARTAGFLVFLILFVQRSRFAWHVFAVTVGLIIPINILVSHSIAMENIIRPGIVWLYGLFGVLALCLVWRSRKRYLRFVAKYEEERFSAE